MIAKTRAPGGVNQPGAEVIPICRYKHTGHVKGSSPLERAKDRITIEIAWERLGLPGRAGQACKSPFRQDTHPSFSVFDQGRRFKDHATGEKGDVVTFVALALQVSESDAAKKVIEFAGASTATAPSQASRLPEEEPTSKERPAFPCLRAPSYRDVLAIQTQRLLPRTAGIEWAAKLKLLFVGDVYDAGKLHAAWILTDDRRVNAQARRLDGQPWESRAIKAKTLPGSWASWPIGTANLATCPNVVLTEGPPDLLAALTVSVTHFGTNPPEIGYACVTGAANNLHADALPLFHGKHVRIVFDQDAAGKAAADRWADQLRGAGATVDGFSLQGLSSKKGGTAKDLDDATTYGPEDENLEAHLPAGLETLALFPEVLK